MSKIHLRHSWKHLPEIGGNLTLETYTVILRRVRERRAAIKEKVNEFEQMVRVG